MNVVQKINTPNHYFVFIGDREYEFTLENGKVKGFLSNELKQKIKECLKKYITQ